MALEDLFPVTYSHIPEDARQRIVSLRNEGKNPEHFLDLLSHHQTEWGLPDFLPELAKLESVRHLVSTAPNLPPSPINAPVLNPTLQLFQSAWKNLPTLLTGAEHPSPLEKGQEWILLWKDLKTDEIILQTASAEELLVLKMVAEDLSPSQVAESEGLPVQKIREAFQRAAAKGFVLTAPSSIQRDPRNFPRGEIQGDAFFSSPYFSLQWHLTQACDLHCKHCYDRSSRSSLPLGQSLKVLDGLESFCQKNNVLGHISFTGGNPFLHSNFFEIYQETARKGFTLAVLGNPVDREKIERILSIQEPAFFQVSLEGLPEHNDDIRGDGHFDRTMKFLEVLKKLKVYSMVMLTLTKDNLDQVLPLAEILRDKTESFFFNRLSPVGEGAHLQLPNKKDYQAFLKSYLEAMNKNPVLGLKDNLFNILLYGEGKELFGGCAGYGCSAAFNFLTLLPDGEIQACRKFPSKIGNILEKSLLEIYDSDQARRYRAGSAACAPCPIRPVCGGCLAVAYGLGLNIFEDRDPFCFYSK